MTRKHISKQLRVLVSYGFVRATYCVARHKHTLVTMGCTQNGAINHQFSNLSLATWRAGIFNRFQFSQSARTSHTLASDHGRQSCRWRRMCVSMGTLFFSLSSSHEIKSINFDSSVMLWSKSSGIDFRSTHCLHEPNRPQTHSLISTTTLGIEICQLSDVGETQ